MSWFTCSCLILKGSYKDSLCTGSQRIDFKTALLVYISDMLEPYEPAGTLRTSGRRLLLEPRVRTKQAEAAFQLYAPKTWNSLPEDVR